MHPELLFFNIIYKTKKKNAGREVQLFVNGKLRHGAIREPVQYHRKKSGSGDGAESIFPEQSYRAQETDPCWNDSVQVLFKLRCFLYTAFPYNTYILWSMRLSLLLFSVFRRKKKLMTEFMCKDD